jgi:hypothetical protein
MAVTRKAPNLYRRIGSLERALRESTPSVCPECAGPIPGESMMVVLNDHGVHHWGRCGTCGLALGHNGKAFGARRLKKGEPRSVCKVLGATAIAPIESMLRHAAACAAQR